MFVAELKLTGKMQDRRLSARRQGFHPSPTHKAINHILPSDHYFSSVSYKHSSSIKWNMSFPRLLDFLVRTVEGNICRHMACRLHLEKHFENWTWTFFSPIMCRWSELLTLNHFSGNYFSWSYTSVYMTLGLRDVWVFLYYYCLLSHSTQKYAGEGHPMCHALVPRPWVGFGQVGSDSSSPTNLCFFLPVSSPFVTEASLG